MADKIEWHPNGTLGPWEIEHNSGYGELNGTSIWNPTGDGYTLAVAIGDVPTLAGQAEANARAIAEVPAMVQILRDMGGWCSRANAEGDAGTDFLNEGGWDDLKPLHDRLGTILARIDGEA